VRIGLFFDLVFTVISLYIFAFIVIHSLTKTFQLKMEKDPLFDIFTISEYFHFFISHLVIYSGSKIFIFLIGILGIFFPLSVGGGKAPLYFAILVGLIFSIANQIGMMLYRVKEKKHFVRIMNLETFIATFFLLTMYLLERPKFSSAHLLFWLSSFFFLFCVLFSQIRFKRYIKS